MRLTILLALAALTACDATFAEVDPGGRTVTGDVDIPVLAVRDIVAGAWAEPDDPQVVGDTSFRSHLNLGFGADYPDRHSVALGEIWQSRCRLEGTWSARRLHVSDRGVIEAERKGDDIQLDVVGIGETEIVVTGTYDGGCEWPGNAIGEWNVEWTITVRVVQPVSAILETQPYSCGGEAQPLAVVGGALAEGFRVRGVDAAGDAFELDNAAPTRQVAWSLRLPEGISATLPSWEDGLTGTVFEGAARDVELFAASGRFATIELASPEQVEAIDMAFVVPVGDRGVDYVLGTEPGVAWDDLYLFDDIRLVVPAAGVPVVDGRSACSGPDPDWFTATISPDQPEPGGVISSWGGRTPVGPGWQITSDGPHTFSLEAPSLAGGAGLSHEVEVVFR